MIQNQEQELREVVSGLDGFRTRLLDLEKSFPEPPEQDVEKDLEAVDLPTELRAILRCVVQDLLGPAIKDLETALSLDPAPRA